MRAFLLGAILLAACNPKSRDELLDGDGDGVLAVSIGGEDCDDGDAGVHPDADEVCGDGTDNDCDGAIDDVGEADQAVWFDGDGDGLGDPATESRACTPGANQVTDGQDCDDTNAAIGAGAPELLSVDGDGDGAGAGAAVWVCAQAGYSAAGGDCDDTRADIGVGVPEWLFADLDGDGIGAGLATPNCPQAGWSVLGDDCDDARVDIGSGAPTALYVDGDGDGLGFGSAVVTCPQAGWVADGSDCDDTTSAIGRATPLHADADFDGFGTGPILVACEGPGWSMVATDCDDTRPDIVDVVATNLYFDGDADGFGAGALTVICPQDDWVSTGGDCNDGNPQVNPDALEVACTSVDDDCDATTPDGPVFDASLDFATLQEGIDLGVGDLLVCPGVYAETLSIHRTVELARAVGGVVEIDPPTGPAVTVVSPAGAVGIDGFTLRGGTGVVDGGKLIGGTVAHLAPLGTLTLTSCAVDDGAANYGAHIGARGPVVLVETPLSDGWVANEGGCIYSTSDVTLTAGSDLVGCAANGDGGALWLEGDLAADASITLSSNLADNGGAIYTGAATVVNLDPATLLTGNHAIGGDGGGVYMAGPSWTGGVLEANEASGDGGGMFNADHAVSDAQFVDNLAAGSGGGMYGAAEVLGCRFEGNTASTGDGGGVYGPGGLTVEASVFTGNEAVLGSGGGIYAVGDLALAGATVLDGNAAAGDGGGIWLGAGLTVSDSPVVDGNSASNGGGLYALRSDPFPDATPPTVSELPVLDLTGLTFGGNTAGTGGALWVESLAVVGLVATANHASADGGGVRAFSSWLIAPDLSENSADEDGGGAYVARTTVSDPQFTANTAGGNGGGLANDGLGFVIVEADEGLFEGNVAQGNGGGIYVAGAEADPAGNAWEDGLFLDGGVLSGNGATLGGGIYVAGTRARIGEDPFMAAASPVTFVGNEAVDGGGLYASRTCPVGANCVSFPVTNLFGSTFESNLATGNGGGAWTATIGEYDGVTFVQNEATGSGGGLACTSGCIAAVTDAPSTFDSNVAGGLGGAVWADSASASLTATTLSGNSAGSGGAFGVSGNVGFAIGVTASNCVFGGNAHDGGGYGDLAYLDGSVDDRVLVHLYGPTWVGLQPSPQVEWIDEALVRGAASVVSGVIAICSAGEGCL